MPDLAGRVVPRRAPRVVQAEVDGELVLMSPRDFAYFGTQGAGDAVWTLIDGQRSVDDIVGTLSSAYAADYELIRAQTLDFIDALVAVGLVDMD